MPKYNLYSPGGKASGVLFFAGLKTYVISLTLMTLAGCATHPAQNNRALDSINAELKSATESKSTVPLSDAAVGAALLPPLKIGIPKSGQASKQALEQKFDLAVNKAPAQQIFMDIVSGTPYSMLVHPEVSGTLSLNLKNVTVFEALDAIREMYGYDYKTEGKRIFIQPLAMQTRMFKINYITGQRKGSSETRVVSGSVSDTPSSSGTTSSGATNPGNATSHAVETSKITTTTDSDFWGELKVSLASIVGDKDGHHVVLNPHSGMVLVRAMPTAIRQVESYLKAMQLIVDRQVMLEAKIIEVQLNDGHQTGINWAGFNKNNQHGFSVGANADSFMVPGGLPVPGSTLGSILDKGISGGLLNVAVHYTNFAGLLSFLDTQGTVHVLSSPRIATINNQKAVLKVGTDDFFVTNVSSTTTTGTGGVASTPNVTLRPFFSGIALDVTPQIAEDGQITLHIRPSVSQVTEQQKVIDLGTSGRINLPLASSTISETDSIVRVQDGHTVAIGGLMRQSMEDDQTKVPVIGDVPLLNLLFRRTNRVSQKRELVILLKTTVVQGDSDWTEDVLQTSERIQKMQGITK